MRSLTGCEREVLVAVVRARAPEDDDLQAALLAQVEAAQVTGPSCPCGCASLGLLVDRAAAPGVDLPELSADAQDGDYLVGLRLLLLDGYLADVEIFGYGDSDDSTWPEARLVR